MSSSDDISLLDHGLRQLQAQQESVGHHVTGNPDAIITLSRDDYGFRKSGISTPLSGPNNPSHIVADSNGLGWPGKSPSHSLLWASHCMCCSQQNLQSHD